MPPAEPILKADGPSKSFLGNMADRLSCADSSFPKLTHDAALMVVADLGFRNVDICVFEGYQHNPPDVVVADPEGAAGRVEERLSRFGLGVSDVFAILGNPLELTALSVNHPDPAIREEAMRRFHPIVRFASMIGAPGITVLPGSVFEGTTAEECLDVSVAELQRRAEVAGESGIGLSFEPHYQSVAETPALTQELLDKAPDVMVTLDHGHFVFQGYSQDEIDVLLPRTRHVQLRQAAPGDMQAPARKGTIDYGLLLGRLADAKYGGYLATEYQWDEWMDFNRVDCISETAELRDLLLELAEATREAG
jgi:sugar phosphate isomerase/epimerase